MWFFQSETTCAIWVLALGVDETESNRQILLEILCDCVCVPNYINLLCVYRFNVATPHITKGSSVRSVYLLLVHNLLVSFVGRLSLSLFSLWEIHYDFTMFLTSFLGLFFLSQNFFCQGAAFLFPFNK